MAFIFVLCVCCWVVVPIAVHTHQLGCRVAFASGQVDSLRQIRTVKLTMRVEGFGAVPVV